MKYNTFIGVDVSKLIIDAHLHLINASKTFSNNEKGFASLLAWVKKHGKVSDLTKAIIAFEHTGMYSIKLAMYLNEVNVSFAMLPALQIKQSIGIRRGKNDQVDAQRIAEYAWLHREKLQATVLPAKGILRLQSLLTGTAPFEHQSGTSINGKTRVSSLSNRQIKKLIHLVAICACAYNPELKVYYKRRLSEGKNKMSTLNVIQNKLIARMFAVVNRGTAYVDLMKHAA